MIMKDYIVIYCGIKYPVSEKKACKALNLY